MRTLTVGCTVVSLIAAGFPVQPSFAQSGTRTSLAALRAETVDKTPDIVAAVKSFPNGGPALRRHIADLIVKDPDTASALAKYLLGPNDLSAPQKQALEAGLADALNRLGIVAQFQAPAISPLLLGVLAIGGIIGLATLIANQDKSGPVSGN